MMNQIENKSDTEQRLASEAQVKLHSGNLRRFVRFSLAFVSVLFLVVLIAGAALILLLQGSTIEHESLTSKIRSSVENLVGPDFEVALGKTDLELKGLNELSVTSREVVINSKATGAAILRLENVGAGIPISPLIKGETKIQSLAVSNATFSLASLTGGETGKLPSHIQQPMGQLGVFLRRMHAQMKSGGLGKFELTNSRIVGEKNASPNASGVGAAKGFDIEFVRLQLDENKHMTLALTGQSGFSQVSANGIYRSEPDSASLQMQTNGLDLREFIPQIRKDGVFGAQGAFNSTLNLQFGIGDEPRQSTVKFTQRDGQLKLGRGGDVKLHAAQLNFRIFPVLNRLALERSSLRIGGLNMQIVGAVIPSDPERGFAGNLDYTVVMERARMTSENQGVAPIPASMVIDGDYSAERKLLSVDQFNFRVPGGSIVGSASMGFEGETPSLVLQGQSPGISTEAIKQYWPIFVAFPARKWVREHVTGGRINSASLDVAIPPGILGRIRQGKRIADDQLNMTVEASDVRFDTFGSLPPITKASGTVQLTGMKTEIELKEGTAYSSDGESLKVKSGTFTVADFAVRPAVAQMSMLAVGAVPVIASIANSKPLTVMDRLSMTPAQWSGNGEVDLVASFPLKRGVKPNEVEWQSFMRISDAVSSKRISGRKISNADVTIDVSASKALIRGKATIDGIRGDVTFIEPVGKGSSTKRKRTMTAVMDAKARKKIGLVVEPVVAGPVLVKMEQREGRKLADISVDLTDAELALPWIGWRKGKGIAGEAKFKMENSKKGTSIEDLEISGPGFVMQGSISFDKGGVRSADIPKLALNEGDDLSVKIRRKKGKFIITANGKKFDGRSLINKVLHQDGVANAQGDATFQLSANIENVRGFTRRSASNMVLHYGVEKGWLQDLKMNARVNGIQTSSIDAATTNNTTLFRISSENAGWALGFLNIYTRMENGVMVADLKRKRGEPFIGNIVVERFDVVDEPKLKTLISNNEWEEVDRGGRVETQLRKIKVNRVRFLQAKSAIIKEDKGLKVDGSLAGVQIGLTYNGTLYDAKDRMDLRGTFMPAFGISRAVSAIPLVGELLSNGRDGGLVGISYHLKGPRLSPKLQLNPISIVAPGVFKRIFEGKR